MNANGLVPGLSHKGKSLNRNLWAELPVEILRQIAEHICLPAWNHHIHHPQPSWDQPYFLPQQKLWAALMCANSLIPLRLVCLQWELALESYYIWNFACGTLDPHYTDAQWLPNPRSSARPVLPERTYTHYAKTLRRCCLPCRFASMAHPHGMNAATTTIWTDAFENIGVCDKHRIETVCALCLKEPTSDRIKVVNGRIAFDRSEHTICQTEDDQFFRWIFYTCKTCRWSFIQPKLAQRIPRQMWQDPTIMSIVDPFVDCGEGAVTEILAQVDERVWLIKYTNYRELRESAVAVEKIRFKQEVKAEREADNMFLGKSVIGNEQQLQAMLDQGASPEAIEAAIRRQEEDEEEDDEAVDEDFLDVLSQAEEYNVVDMALSGWARARILEGCWVTPYDVHMLHIATRLSPDTLSKLTPAWHPVNSFLTPNDEGESYPRIPTIKCPAPPRRIFQRTQHAFAYTFRLIVLPALQNLVRRIVYEAELEGKDVCRVVPLWNSAMLMEELPGVHLWGKEYDWHSQAQISPTITSSDGHSPPSAMTTPSPPPTTIKPLAPAPTQTHLHVLPPPSNAQLPLPTRYLDHIPHVPRAKEHIGSDALVLLDEFWREAISGLFKCHCGICSRASGVKKHDTSESKKEEGEGEDEIPRLTPEVDTILRPIDSPMSSGEEEEDGMEGVESPMKGSGRRRSREEADEDDQSLPATGSDDESREAKKIRVSPPV